MMLFWIVLALMTAAAVFAVLWPMSRSPRLAGEGAGLAVYRDQLAEIEADRARGVLPASEAESAKLEVSRRLLSAASAEQVSNDTSLGKRRLASILALVLIPALGLPLYLKLGSPEYPDAPLADRVARPLPQQDIGLLIGRIEESLEKNPERGEGWELIAPIYARVGRTGDAVSAQERAISLLGATSAREVALGEFIRIANGKITPESKAAFERAFALDQQYVPALFYLGLEASETGRNAEAAKLWTRVIELSKPNDPWRIPAERRLKMLENRK